MRRNLMLFALVLTAVVAVDSSTMHAFAQATSTGSSAVFTNLQNKAQDLFYNVRTVILIISALAIVATMASAISGRFPVGKAIAIVGAIVVIGVSSEIVTYFAGTVSNGSANSGGNYSLTDTAGGSSP